jgi:iron complex transport system permease protein
MRPLPSVSLVGLLGATAITFLVSLGIGQFHIAPSQVIHILWAHLLRHPSGAPANIDTVVMLVRLPRIWTAVLVGASLSISGVSYQTVFRNPVVSPSLLGVSAGAGFGAAIALLCGASWGVVQMSAFSGGLITVAIALGVHRALGERSVVTLVLCGLVVAAFFESLLALVKYVADPLEVLPTITFWLMGSLEKVTATEAGWATLPIVLCALLIYLMRWHSAVLAVGDDEATSLGVSVRPTRSVIIAAATLMVAVAVSLTGIIGWVGLIVPHAARMLFGLSPNRLYPAAALLGATFLLLVDDLARSGTNTELPLGALTALIGAPSFLLLLTRLQRTNWT